jgi:F0F1-type ATP synthase assembly protein I
MKSPNDPSGPPTGLQQSQIGFSLALGLALDLAVCIALGFWADRRFGTKPWLTLVGILLGLVTAGATIFAMTRAANGRRGGNGPA